MTIRAGRNDHRPAPVIAGVAPVDHAGGGVERRHADLGERCAVSGHGAREVGAELRSKDQAGDLLARARRSAARRAVVACRVGSSGPTYTPLTIGAALEHWSTWMMTFSPRTGPSVKVPSSALCVPASHCELLPSMVWAFTHASEIGPLSLVTTPDSVPPIAHHLVVRALLGGVAGDRDRRRGVDVVDDRVGAGPQRVHHRARVAAVLEGDDPVSGKQRIGDVAAVGPGPTASDPVPVLALDPDADAPDRRAGVVVHGAGEARPAGEGDRAEVDGRAGEVEDLAVVLERDEARAVGPEESLRDGLRLSGAVVGSGSGTARRGARRSRPSPPTPPCAGDRWPPSQLLVATDTGLMQIPSRGAPVVSSSIAVNQPAGLQRRVEPGPRLAVGDGHAHRVVGVDDAVG